MESVEADVEADVEVVAGVVEVVRLCSSKLEQVLNTMTRNIAPTIQVNNDVFFFGFAPHLTQAAALSLISVPHSEHLTRAMTTPVVYHRETINSNDAANSPKRPSPIWVMHTTFINKPQKKARSVPGLSNGRSAQSTSSAKSASPTYGTRLPLVFRMCRSRRSM